MYFPSRTPYGGPVPTPRDSAVANQLIDLEDWGGNISLRWGVCYGSGESSAPSPGVSESSLWSGALVFGMGNSRSGVGVFFLVWAIALGVGNLLSEWGVFDDATLVWEIRSLVWGIRLWNGKLR